MKTHYTDSELAAIQVEKEIEMKCSGISRFHLNNERSIEHNSASDTEWNRRIMQELVEPMAKAIDIYLNYYKGRRGKPSRSLLYLKALPSKEAAYITIKNVLNSLTRETEIRQVAKVVGQRIEDQVRFSGLSDNAPTFIERVESTLKANNNHQYKHRQAVYANAESSLIRGNPKKGFDPKPHLKWRAWPESDIVQLGAKLIDIFADNILFEGEPVICKYNTKRGRKELCFLDTTEHIDGWIERYKGVMELLSPAFAPCVIPPRDWSTPVNGGYHIKDIASTLPMVKCRKTQLKKLTKKQMPKVYKAINFLQKVPWKVSDRVLNVAQECLTLGIELGIPQKEPYVFPEAPIPPEYMLLRGKNLKAVMSKEQWSLFVHWKRETTKLHKLEKERQADYIKIARLIATTFEYKEFEKIFFVYTADFRGRLYCRTDSVSPQGDDLSRGLIKFSNGMALGERGKYWLAVQGANLWGEDKITFDERVAFIENMTEEIRDIAADPVLHTSWAAADKPWQFLNWCFEWSDLSDSIEEGNRHQDFISHIPVGMDGSCSGIQHYSCILRDPVAGRAVNLVPDNKPHDIYGDVAEVAKIEFRELSETGEDAKIRAAASGWLVIKGGFSRDPCKKPCMTITYGSTQINCLEKTGEYLTSLQIKENKAALAEQRDAQPVHLFAESPDKEGVYIFEAVKLGSKVIWSAIGKVVVGPKIGMRFIQQVAWAVAKSGKHLEWTTPTGFIIEQHEYEYESKRVKTQLMGQTFMTLKLDTQEVNKRKSKTSSAPNFIHGCDASHLTLTVDASEDEGIKDLAVVHDEFAAHAGNTDLLRKILRNTLPDMYLEHDVLKNFKDECEAHILDVIDVNLPESMGLDLNVIRESEYCFG